MKIIYEEKILIHEREYMKRKSQYIKIIYEEKILMHEENT